MGLFGKIFGKQKQINPQGYFEGLTSYSPRFSTWNGMLYESELVRSSIDAVARHNSKLAIKVAGSAKMKLQTQLKYKPNNWQTWSQFLYRLTTILLMQNTAIVVPVLDEFGSICGIYPILPSSCEVVEVNNEPWLRYQFSNGKRAAIEFKSCGIMTRFQYKDDFFGEANTALNDTMDLINIQSQGVKEAAKSSATYRFMAKVSNFTKPDDLAKERKRFTEDNFKEDGGGMLLFPNTYTDIRQINSTAYSVDPAEREIIQKNVFNYFGVNEEIIQSKADSTLLDAFFNGTIEPFSIQLSEVLTNMIFSQKEQANSARINVTSNRLMYMSISQKINMAQQLGDRGMITINEIRELFNYEPIEGGDRLPIRGEYKFINDEEGSEENEDDSGQD